MCTINLDELTAAAAVAAAVGDAQAELEPREMRPLHVRSQSPTHIYERDIMSNINMHAL